MTRRDTLEYLHPPKQYYRHCHRQRKKETHMNGYFITRAGKRSPLFISTNMSGKMSDIWGLSTSVLENHICALRRGDPESICSKCFAAATVGRYHALQRHMDDNYHLLQNILPDEDLPIIPADIFRLESFGDLGSVNQALNYLRICELNPTCTFALWTKNPGFLDKAIRRAGKPKNLICILSSPKLDIITDQYPRFDWLGHVFTVYHDWAKPDEEINCGARSCRGCMRCYTLGNDEFFISERLK